MSSNKKIESHTAGGEGGEEGEIQRVLRIMM